MKKETKGNTEADWSMRIKRTFEALLVLANLFCLYMAITYRILWVMAIIILNMLYYINNLKITRYKDENYKIKVLEQKLLEEESHTIFNTLNIISYFTRNDDTLARKLIVELSTYLRDVSKNDKDIVKIEEEIKTLNSYIYIQKIRFEQDFDLAININDVEYVPKLLLLRLVKLSCKINTINQRGAISSLNIYSSNNTNNYVVSCKKFKEADIVYENFNDEFIKLFKEELMIKYDGNLTIDISSEEAKISIYIDKSNLGEAYV
ncbi:histidine kinase [Clostridium sp. YIM B02505]|uniref:Histidine kinase n=1 Tax=Clostridium yunnanense TaxID=2800325 RepID=A0ABS1EQG3_9CLOT|nr:sensor histidine kinase [Clostridium yunnanense]MBK1811580.1 histidine kinase [Clostridium yunnanense]